MCLYYDQYDSDSSDDGKYKKSKKGGLLGKIVNKKVKLVKSILGKGKKVSRRRILSPSTKRPSH
jgi:hypothetical protein